MAHSRERGCFLVLSHSNPVRADRGIRNCSMAGHRNVTRAHCGRRPVRHGAGTESVRRRHRLSLMDDDPASPRSAKGLIMVTPTLILILLAGAPPPQSASKPPAPTTRSSQPSPERVQALQTTIEKRRKRLAERRRIDERNRNALYLELRANTRLPANSARLTTNLPGGDPFDPKAGAYIRGMGSPPFGRGDPFAASQPPASGGSASFQPCFT